MKLIFLDVDGVLINGNVPTPIPIPVPPAWSTPDPACIAALNRITDATKAGIIVSSCWRIGRTVIELRELLISWGVTGKVLDRTGDMLHNQNRGAEIAKWLESYPRDVESFVILDDDSDMGSLLSNLVQSEFRIGLTPVLAEQAIRILETR